MRKIYKPTNEIPSFYQPYIDCVPDDGNLIEHLLDIQSETHEFISGIPEERLDYRYANDKWTIKDIILHLADCERVIIYRAMRIARADKTNLPAFDENLFVTNAHASDRKIDNILNELSAFRSATIVFIENLDDELLDRMGTANGYPLSARLLVNHIYGHHRHHLNIIRERYLPGNNHL
ncbi:MAG: DinB family protein [Ginsengibacter sp.]